MYKFSDQQKMLDALKRYKRKFERKELDDYTMFVKRIKDDEDLDKLSLARLKELYDKYHANRPKPNLDNLFKKTDSDNTDED